MSITIKFLSKPSEDDLKEFEKLVHKFAGVSVDNQTRVESLIKKAKTPMDVLACKYCAKFRHSETMKLINKKEREIKKKQKEMR